MSNIIPIGHGPQPEGSLRDRIECVPVPPILQEALLTFDPDGSRGGPEILYAYQSAVFAGRDARDALAKAVKSARCA